LESKLSTWGGPAHPSVAGAFSDLAKSLVVLGGEPGAREAVDLASRGLAVAERFHGSESIRYATTLGILAMAKVQVAWFAPDEAVGLRAAAVEHATRALEIERRIRSDNPKALFTTREIHVAEALAASGDGAALDTFERLLRRQAEKKVHPERFAELRWNAERFVRLLEHHGATARVSAVREEFRLDEPDSQVLEGDEFGD
jgi:hypothetical protein